MVIAYRILFAGLLAGALAAIFSTLSPVSLSPASRDGVADESGIDPAFSEPLFAPRDLSGFVLEGVPGDPCRALFSDESMFVQLGTNASGVDFYRFYGRLRKNPSLSFDFEGDRESFRSFLKEAAFVSDGIGQGMLSTGADLAASTWGGIDDVVSDVVKLIGDIAVGSYRLALDSDYREDFMNSIAGVFTRLGRKIDDLTWSGVWQALQNIDMAEIGDAVRGIAILYWEDAREREALTTGFGTESIRLGDATWDLLESRTGARVAGSLLPDITIITISIILAAPSGGTSLSLSSVGSLGRSMGTKLVGKAGRSGLLRMAAPGEAAELASLFAHAGTLSSRARRALEIRNAASATKLSRIRSLRPLVDPARISTLTADRAMNPRFKQLLYQIYTAEAAGMKPADVIGEVYGGLRGNPVPTGYFHSARLESGNIETSYQLAREWGLFDSPGNLDALRYGRSPTILRGPHAGELVDVDHRVPVKFAPELSNSPGNLILSPASINRTRGAALDPRTKSAVEAFEKETHWRAGPELRGALTAF